MNDDEAAKVVSSSSSQGPVREDPAPYDEGLSGAIKALIDDGQTLFQAELAYRKEQAAFGLGAVKRIAVLVILGLAFGFFTLLAIVVGLLMALAQYVGFWGSLAIVGGLLAILTAICLLRAAKAVRYVRSGLAGKDAA
ncbi:Putative Holin-X, holin superfamily III [Novosphingobium sp. B1]|nr:Putative Holin-X, holin superfamily III [Novosphingobium sp. B1]